MKKAEIKILERIYKILQIPGPAGIGIGTQSGTVHGFVSYSKDCQYVIPKIQQVLYAIGNGETWEGEIGEVLIEVEEWKAKRESEGWN